MRGAFVICGPPGCGKTTWVGQRARPGDLVWDLDEIAAVMFNRSRPLLRHHGTGRARLPWLAGQSLLAMRDGMVAWLATHEVRQGSVFIIVTDERQAKRIADTIGAVVVKLAAG